MAGLILRLQIPDPSMEPDVFEPAEVYSGTSSRPSSDFVISRLRDGTVLSHYGDSVWDFTPYQTIVISSSKVNFIGWAKEISPQTQELGEEFKWIFFILLTVPSGGRSGFFTVSYLLQYTVVLNKLCRFAYSKRLSISSILSDSRNLRQYIEYCGAGSDFSKLTGLMWHLLRAGFDVTGMNILGGRDLDELKFLSKQYHDNIKQTPPIPSRLYSLSLTILHDLIDEFLSFESEILSFFKKAYDIDGFGRKKPCFLDAADECGLTKLAQKRQIESLSGLSSYVSMVREACILLVHAYSGMRKNEVLSLPHDCLYSEKTKEGRVVKLLGYTTKFVGTKKIARWITSEDVVNAIKAASVIVDAVSYRLKVPSSDLPMFVSADSLRRTTKSLREAKVSTTGDTNKALVQRIFGDALTITEEDLVELERVDPGRCWRDEPEFSIGLQWQIRTHQFRRSLALYCSQSGIVSLPTLKRQLKHITREMVMHYSKGYQNAETFFNADDNHFLHEFRRTKPETDALSYIYNILLSEEALIGGHGTWVELKKKPQGRSRILANREATIKRFRKGEMSYTETPLGGCMSNEACDKRVMRSVTACINCAQAAIQPSKLDKVIVAQEKLIANLSPSSIEHRIEVDQLEDLRRLKSKVKGGNHGAH